MSDAIDSGVTVDSQVTYIHTHSFHRQFVFGDMNYRMRLSAEEMVQRVAATARALEASVWYVVTKARS